MKNLIVKFNGIKTVICKKNNITNYSAFIALLELLQVKYIEDCNNLTINLNSKKTSQREMDAMVAGIYMFCESFNICISTT